MVVLKAETRCSRALNMGAKKTVAGREGNFLHSAQESSINESLIAGDKILNVMRT